MALEPLDHPLQGQHPGRVFIETGDQLEGLAPALEEEVAPAHADFYETLQAANAEFGFRVAKEGASFLHFHKLLSGDGWEFRKAMDAQILQKLLRLLPNCPYV